MQQSLFSSMADTFDLPDAELHYYPDVIDQEQRFYEYLSKKLAWRHDRIKMYGKWMKIPRLNAWYGDPDTAYSYSGITLAPLLWTPELLTIKQQVEQLTGHCYNSVLANWYRTGEDSVSWHSDDEPELGVNPVIASVSLGATRRFSLRHKDATVMSGTRHIDLEGGSVLLMAGRTQACWQHQLAKTKQAVGGRINLTFRTIYPSSKFSTTNRAESDE